MKLIKKLFPILISAGIVPFIVRAYIYSNDVLVRYEWFADTSYTSLDLFLAYKSFVLQIMMAVMTVLLADRIVISGQKLKWNKMFVLLFIYLLFVVISAAASGYPGLAFGGAYERFEPAGVVASYLVLFYYSYDYVRGEKDIQSLFISMSPFFICMLIIGIMQSIGYDPFRQPVVNRLAVPSGLRETLGSLSVNREAGIAYLTLYNENYAGIYITLFIPVLLIMIISCKKVPAKAGIIVMSVAAFFVLYHTRSRAGFIALAVSVLFTAAVMMWGRMKHGKIIVTLMVFVMGVSCIFVINRADSLRHLSGADDEVKKVLDIKTGDDEVVFYIFGGNELHSSFTFDKAGKIKPVFWDKDGNLLSYRETGGACVIDECFEYVDASVAGRYVKETGKYAAVFLIDGHKWPIVRGDNGTYFYLNPVMKEVKYPQIDELRLFPDGFMSGRGDIWNKSIPLIRHSILKGYGSNMFVLAYPQDDYIKKTYMLGRSAYEYDVKPHSFYLENIIENGLISGVCIILFFAYYTGKGAIIFSGIELSEYRRSFSAASGLGLYTGCVSYLVSALVNDSSVCTAPVFYMMLGISMAVNEMLYANYNSGKT